jgi:lysophospholipase L1-like esterase
VALNDWIRNSGVFDQVVDFDAALRDPSRPAYLDKAYDSGDGLHPSTAGYRALAEAVPLSALSRPCKDRP